MASEAKELFAVRLTTEQRQALEHFIAFHDWDVERVHIPDTGNESTDNADTNNDVGMQQVQAAEPTIQAIPGTEQCPFCFCQPCVTTTRQQWLGQGQPPMPGNNLLRKKTYKHFWTMMNRRGGLDTVIWRRRQQHKALTWMM